MAYWSLGTCLEVYLPHVTHAARLQEAEGAQTSEHSSRRSWATEEAMGYIISSLSKVTTSDDSHVEAAVTLAKWAPDTRERLRNL